MSRICVLKLSRAFWRDAPLAPVIRAAELHELALLRSCYRALRLIDLQPEKPSPARAGVTGKARSHSQYSAIWIADGQFAVAFGEANDLMTAATRLRYRSEWEVTHPNITWIGWGVVWAIVLALLIWPRRMRGDKGRRCARLALKAGDAGVAGSAEIGSRIGS